MSAPLLRLTGGFLLWAAAFVLLYGLHGTGCVLGWHDSAILAGASPLQLILWALALVDLALAALLVWLARGWVAREPAPLPRAALLATLGALLASLINFGSVFLLAPC